MPEGPRRGPPHRRGAKVESFSDVVRRLLAPSGSWRELVGILGDEGDAMVDWLKEHRAAERRRARRKWQP